LRSWVLREWGDNVKKAFDKQEIQRPWDRRSFLKAIGVLGVSAVGAAALPTVITGPRRKLGRWSIDDTLRVGIVGPGRRGGNLMARLGYQVDMGAAPEQTIEGLELVAVCDTFAGRREEARASIAAVHDSTAATSA